MAPQVHAALVPLVAYLPAGEKNHTVLSGSAAPFLLYSLALQYRGPRPTNAWVWTGV